MKFKQQRSAIIIVVLLLSLGMSGVGPSTVHACTSSGPDPWFIANLNFDEGTLPAGVTVDENASPTVYLHNTSNTSLYLIKSLNNGASFRNTELPASVRPQYKLENAKAYRYDYSDNIYKQYSQLPENDRANTHVNLSWRQLSMFGARFAAVFPSEDNRPNDVSVPPDEPFTFTAYYGTQPFQIRGTFQFALNPDYDPNVGAKGYQLCLRSNATDDILNIVILGALVLIPVVLISVLVGVIRHHKKRASSETK